MDFSSVLLAVDCDGTLLDDNKRISHANLAAIREFRVLGGKFTLATGRSLPTAASILREVEPELPVILYNGSMLYDPVRKTPIWMAEIPHDARFVVEKAMEQVPYQAQPTLDDILASDRAARQAVASLAAAQ